MSNFEELSDIIECIYATAMEPAHWGKTLARISTFLDAQACSIVVRGTRGHTALPIVDRIGGSHSKLSHDEIMGQVAPLTRLPNVGQVISILDLLPGDRGSFYQEWLRARNWDDFALVTLEAATSGGATLMTIVPNGEVSNELRQRTQLLVPHLRRTLTIGTTLEVKRAESEQLANTLDGLGAGLFLVDSEGGIVHVNIAGQSMLRANDFLRSLNGRLVTRDSAVNSKMRDLFAAQLKSGDRVADKGMAFALTADDGERYIIHALPLLRAPRRIGGSAGKATFALFVERASLGKASTPDNIASAYNLTPTELRVMLGIVEVGGVPEVADALGVASSTVKTHLTRIFAKTDTRRQVDLVKLMAAFRTPLAH